MENNFSINNDKPSFYGDKDLSTYSSGARGRLDPLCLTHLCPQDVASYLPDGHSRPSILRAYNVIANVLIEDEDLLIIYKPHSISSFVGVMYSWGKNQTNWHYLGGIKPSIDLSSFDYVRSVSADLTVFSDTISTTNSVLSGRITTIKVYDLGLEIPSYSTLSSYTPLSNHKIVNVALSTGTHTIQRPYYVDFTKTTALNFDREHIGYPCISIPCAGGSSTATTTIYTMNPTPTVSGSLFIRCGLHWSAPFAADTQLTLGFHYKRYSMNNAGAEVITDIWHFAYQNMTDLAGDSTYFEDYVNADPSEFLCEVTYTFNNAGPNFAMNIDIHTVGPGLLRDGLDTDITIVQGSEGKKNMNISGIINYQIIPKTNVMQQAQLVECPAATFVPLEVFNAYTSVGNPSGLALVMTRVGYADWYSRFHDSTSVATGTAATICGHSSTTGVCGMFSFLKPVLRGAQKVTKILPKVLPYAEKGVDYLEKAGLASVGYCSFGDSNDTDSKSEPLETIEEEKHSEESVVVNNPTEVNRSVAIEQTTPSPSMSQIISPTPGRRFILGNRSCGFCMTHGSGKDVNDGDESTLEEVTEGSIAMPSSVNQIEHDLSNKIEYIIRTRKDLWTDFDEKKDDPFEILENQFYLVPVETSSSSTTPYTVRTRPVTYQAYDLDFDEDFDANAPTTDPDMVYNESQDEYEHQNPNSTGFNSIGFCSLPGSTVVGDMKLDDEDKSAQLVQNNRRVLARARRIRDASDNRNISRKGVEITPEAQRKLSQQIVSAGKVIDAPAKPIAEDSKTILEALKLRAVNNIGSLIAAGIHPTVTAPFVAVDIVKNESGKYEGVEGEVAWVVISENPMVNHTYNEFTKMADLGYYNVVQSRLKVDQKVELTRVETRNLGIALSQNQVFGYLSSYSDIYISFLCQHEKLKQTSFLAAIYAAILADNPVKFWEFGFYFKHINDAVACMSVAPVSHAYIKYLVFSRAFASMDTTLGWIVDYFKLVPEYVIAAPDPSSRAQQANVNAIILAAKKVKGYGGFVSSDMFMTMAVPDFTILFAGGNWIDAFKQNNAGNMNALRDHPKVYRLVVDAGNKKTSTYTVKEASTIVESDNVVNARRSSADTGITRSWSADWDEKLNHIIDLIIDNVRYEAQVGGYLKGDFNDIVGEENARKQLAEYKKTLGAFSPITLRKIFSLNDDELIQRFMERDTSASGPEAQMNVLYNMYSKPVNLLRANWINNNVPRIDESYGRKKDPEGNHIPEGQATGRGSSRKAQKKSNQQSRVSAYMQRDMTYEYDKEDGATLGGLNRPT